MELFKHKPTLIVTWPSYKPTTIYFLIHTQVNKQAFTERFRGIGKTFVVK